MQMELEVTHLRIALQNAESEKDRLIAQLQDCSDNEEKMKARVSHLQQRNAMLVKDLASERAEREHIQSRHREAQLELYNTKRKLDQNQEVEMADISHRRQNALIRYQQQYEQQQQQPRPGLGSRGLTQCDSIKPEEEEGYDTIDFDTSDIFPVSSVDKAFNATAAILKTTAVQQSHDQTDSEWNSSKIDGEDSHEEIDGDRFACPACGKQYPVLDSDKYLSHRNNCF